MSKMKLSSTFLQQPRLLDNSNEDSAATESADTIHKPLHQEEEETFDLTANPKETVQRILGIHDPVRQQASKHCEDNVEHYTMRLVRAVRSSNTEELRQMLNNDSNRNDIRNDDEDEMGSVCFNACNNQGETLLHLACRRSNLDTVKFLVLEAGVDVHVRDDMGRSILHDVFWRPEPATEHLELLLSVMDPSFLLLQDSRGHTPLDYSRQENRKEWNLCFQKNRSLLQKGANRVPDCTVNET